MNNKLYILITVAFLFNVVNAQPLKQDSKLIKGKLKNGFTYYIYPSSNEPNQSLLRLFVNAGSLQETDQQQGLAHFVEHMAFNGTKSYSKNEVITFLESKGVKFGADLNAHTSFDETVYKITMNTVDKENLAKAIDIMADWAYGVSFDSLEIEKERGVVIEEWRSKQGAKNRLSEQYLPVLFHQSRYAERLPIGQVDILKSFKRAEIVNFYNKWYRPDLMSIVVVTDVDPKEVVKYIKKQFSAYQPKAKPERIYYDLPAHQDTLFSIVTDKEATAIEMSMYTKLPAFGAIKTEQDFKLYLQRKFLNNLASRRFNRVAQLQANFKGGSLSISSLVQKNAMLGKGIDLYSDYVEDGVRDYLTEEQRIFRFGYTAEEINNLKKEYIRGLERSLENEDKTLYTKYADDIKADFYDGNTVVSKTEELKLSNKYLPSIDSASLISYLRTFRQKGNTVVLLTAPESEADHIPTKDNLRSMFADAEKETVKPWADHVDIPKALLQYEPIAGRIIKKSNIKEVGVTVWELSNGITVHLKPSTERKNYLMLSGFREGGIYALDSTKYVSGLFAKQVIGLSGAGNFSRKALSQFLTGNSASATMAISNTREGVVASADWKDVETMFKLMYLKWTAPNMDTVVFNQTKRKAIESYNNAKLSPSYNYNIAISKFLKADEDYNTALTADRIEKELDPNEILPIYKSRFASAKNFDFVIVGDFDEDSLAVYVEKYLASLPGTAHENNYAYHGPESLTAQKDILMYAGAAPKSTVNLIYQSNDVIYDYPDILVQELLQEVLKVKLRVNLREDNSGVYGVGVAISSTNKPAPLIRSRITFSCAPESARFLIGQAQAEVKKIAKDPDFFKAELENIKVQVLDAYDKQADKNSFWSANLRNHLYFGYKNFSFFTDYPKMLEKISAEQISAMAEKYLIKSPMIEAVLMPENSKSIQ